MTDFKTLCEDIPKLLKDNALGLGVPEKYIVVGEYGKSAKMSSPFIIMYPTISKDEQYENNSFKGKGNIGIVCGAGGNDMLQNQIDSVKILGRILTLMLSSKLIYNIELIDTIAFTSTVAVQLLAISTKIELAEPLIVEEPS